MVALAVAAALAVFLLYTSIAGGTTASLRPSQLSAHVYLKGRLQQGRFVGERNSLVTKCPSKYVPKKQT